MAFVTERKDGRWELRESVSTDGGPRSRTLATFDEVTPEVIAHARERANKPLEPEDIRRAARRAGAPIAPSGADRAASELLHELSRGRVPRARLRVLLLDSLEAVDGIAPSRTTDGERAAGQWVGVSDQKRGEALRDLLLLTDKLPRRRPRAPLRYPRLGSRPA